MQCTYLNCESIMVFQVGSIRFCQLHALPYSYINKTAKKIEFDNDLYVTGRCLEGLCDEAPVYKYDNFGSFCEKHMDISQIIEYMMNDISHFKKCCTFFGIPLNVNIHDAILEKCRI